MRLLPRLKNQRGDTIIEVLIVVAVLSMILVICFTLANRSTLGTRQAQERSEAFKGTESQMELLKTYLSRDAVAAALPPSGSKFCMKADGTPTAAIAGTVPNNAQQETFAAFQQPELLANCKKGDYFYNYIERNGDTFTAHTRWYKVGGQGIDEATMVHRIYPDLASGAGSGGTGTTECAPNSGLNVVGACTPCPNGYSSPGKFVPLSACQPILPTFVVTVKKIPPAANNTTPSCSAAGTANRSGTGVRLTAPGVTLNGTTNAASQATFGNLSVNTLYTAGVTAPTGYELCPPATQAATTGNLGPAPGVGPPAATANFKIRPICYVQTNNNWVQEPVPGSYYADIVGWTGYWAKGIRAGHPGFPGEYTDGWFGNMGPSTVVGAPSGNAYYFEWDGRTASGGRFWYNVWQAVWVNVPVYGQPYYHQYQWVNYPTYTNVCPT